MLGFYRLSQETDNETKVFVVVSKKKEEVSVLTCFKVCVFVCDEGGYCCRPFLLLKPPIRWKLTSFPIIPPLLISWPCWSLVQRSLVLLLDGCVTTYVSVMSRCFRIAFQRAAESSVASDLNHFIDEEEAVGWGELSQIESPKFANITYFIHLFKKVVFFVLVNAVQFKSNALRPRPHGWKLSVFLWCVSGISP